LVKYLRYLFENGISLKNNIITVESKEINEFLCILLIIYKTNEKFSL